MYAPDRIREGPMDYRELVWLLGEKAIAAGMELDEIEREIKKEAHPAMIELISFFVTACGMTYFDSFRALDPRVSRFFLHIFATLEELPLSEVTHRIGTLENLYRALFLEIVSFDQIHIRGYFEKEAVKAAKLFCLAIHRQALLETMHSHRFQRITA